MVGLGIHGETRLLVACVAAAAVSRGLDKPMFFGGLVPSCVAFDPDNGHSVSFSEWQW